MQSKAAIESLAYSLRTRRRGHPVILSSILIAMLGALPLISSAARPPTQESPPQTKGFIVSNWAVANYAGPEDCPNGMTLDAIPAYLETLSSEERARIERPENASELYMKASGDAKRDACNYPTLFPRPPIKLVQGKIAYGLNLDGRESDHDFISPSGERGIDNQFYRTTGCTKKYRRGGAVGASNDRMTPNDETFTSSLRSGELTILIEVEGLKDLHRDGEVMVGMYTGVDPAATDAQGNTLPYTTQRITDNVKWQNRTRGRMTNGVLTSEPVDLRLRYQSAMAIGELFLRRAQVRLMVQPDGSLKGILGGYYDLEALWGFVPRGYARTLPLGGSFDCPSYYKGLHDLADGPLNAAGKHDSISAAFEIEAVPAFIVHAASDLNASTVVPKP